jgi:hypothetical protein
MLFSLLYFLVRRLLGAGGGRPDENDIELLVLRHQVKVLQRQVARPRLNRLDRVLLAATSRAMTRTSWSSFIVRPETLLRWHPRAAPLDADRVRHGQGGRTPPSLARLCDPRGPINVARSVRDEDQASEDGDVLEELGALLRRRRSRRSGLRRSARLPAARAEPVVPSRRQRRPHRASCCRTPAGRHTDRSVWLQQSVTPASPGSARS